MGAEIENNFGLGSPTSEELQLLQKEQVAVIEEQLNKNWDLQAENTIKIKKTVAENSKERIKISETCKQGCNVLQEEVVQTAVEKLSTEPLLSYQDFKEKYASKSASGNIQTILINTGYDIGSTGIDRIVGPNTYAGYKAFKKHFNNQKKPKTIVKHSLKHKGEAINLQKEIEDNPQLITEVETDYQADIVLNMLNKYIIATSGGFKDAVGYIRRDIKNSNFNAKLVQSALKIKGLYHGKIDGNLGPLSLAAHKQSRGVENVRVVRKEKTRNKIKISEKILGLKATINSASNVIGISSNLYFAVVQRESNFRGNNLTHVTHDTFRDMSIRKSLYLPLFQKIAQNGLKLGLSNKDINAFKMGDIKYLKSRNHKDNKINIILGIIVFKTKEKAYKEFNKDKIVNLRTSRINRLTKIGRNVNKMDLKNIYKKIESNNSLRNSYHTLVNYNGNNKSFKGENYPHKYFYAIANLLDARMV